MVVNTIKENLIKLFVQLRFWTMTNFFRILPPPGIETNTMILYARIIVNNNYKSIDKIMRKSITMDRENTFFFFGHKI